MPDFDMLDTTIDLYQINSCDADDIEAVIEWCDEIYDDRFSKFFQRERELFQRLQSKSRPITDEELEWILTMLPLELFSVAEVLNKFKISQEVVKLKTKQKKAHIIETSAERTATRRQEVAALAILEDELLHTAYSTVIDRVEREISFSRELIMSAKKIWDSRHRENINPISEVSVPDPVHDLPDYKS